MTDSQQPPQPESPQPTEVTSISGGVDLDAQRDVNIGGDVVGRDKIEQISGDKVVGDKIVAGDDVAITTQSGGQIVAQDDVVVQHQVVIDQRRQISRTVIQIGQFNVPLLPLIIIGGVALAALALIGLGVVRLNQSIAVTPTPSGMSATTFNVAIVEFGVLEARGAARATDQSRALSQSVYDTLLAQRDAFPDPIIKSSIAIRYGGAPIIDEAAAAKLVEQIGADMVIYGNLAADGSFAPQFYISPDVRAQIDAALTGQQQVGTLAFTPGATFGATTDLRTRASFFFFIATGLTYDVFGRTARSLEIYRQAEQQLIDWPERGAGKEVLYFFKGQAALYQAQQATAQTATELLDEAEAAFQRAIASNPNYARAHVGLGSLNLIRLQGLPDLAAVVDLPETTAMFDQYQQAATLAQQSADRLVEAIATFGLGSANYMLGGARQFRGEFDQADAAYDEAARLIDASRSILTDFKQTRFLAQTDLALGAVFDQQAQLKAAQAAATSSRELYQRAQQAYQQCVDRGRNSADRILLDLIIGQRCQPNLDKIKRLLAGGS